MKIVSANLENCKFFKILPLYRTFEILMTGKNLFPYTKSHDIYVQIDKQLILVSLYRAGSGGSVDDNWFVTEVSGRHGGACRLWRAAI